jgi:hypothetical protein
MPSFTKEELLQSLQTFVEGKGAILLLAAESGSRGWGFASPDSDYDMRFIYAWPKDKCFSPFPTQDTIRWMDESGDLDFEGWSLEKVMKSLNKGNTVPLEWAQSPVIYYDRKNFSSYLVDIFGREDNFQPKPCIGHYKGMAEKAEKEGSAKVFGPPQIKVKKLFYALRCYLAGIYTINTKHMPPMSWEALVKANVDYTNEALLKEWDYLMEQKTQNGEKHEVSIPPETQKFLGYARMTLNMWMDKTPSSLPLPHDKFSQFYRYIVEGLPA